jgi:serine protease inhibitor
MPDLVTCSYVGGRHKCCNFTSTHDGIVSQIDFDDPSAARTINNWVNASTLGLIDSVLEEGPIDGDLCAVNSIYLNAGWAHFFSPEKTNEDHFYTSPTRTTERAEKAHFMHMVNDRDYSADAIPGFQLLELPYRTRQGGLYMAIVIPMMESTGTVTSPDIAAAHQHLTSRRVAVALPKFQFQSSTTLFL